MTGKTQSVDKFKAELSNGGGFAKPSLYRVVLPVLNLVSTLGIDYRGLDIMTKSISLPSRSLLTVNRTIGSDLSLIPYGYQNGNVGMTFRVTNDQNSRNYIEQWQSYIVSRTNQFEGHTVAAYPDTYRGNIEIYQLKNKAGQFGDLESVYKWTLYEAFPVSFSQETLTDDAKNSMSEISVDFAYRYWKGQTPDEYNKTEYNTTFI